MSVLSFAENDIFYAVSLHHLAGNNDVKWGNVYTIQANFAGGVSDFTMIANAIHASENSLLFSDYMFDRVRFSTYAKDSNPYDGNEFANVEYNTLGSRPGGGELAALDVTIYCRKAVQSGFNGKLELRGSLAEADIKAVAGKWTATNESALLTSVNNAMQDLNDYIQNGDNIFRMVVVSENGAATVTRRVTQVIYNKVSDRKLTRARKRIQSN